MATLICLLLSRNNEEESLNLVDKFFRHQICERVQRALKRRKINVERLARCFYVLVMTLSDQQLATGIAIPAAAIKRLNAGTISIYHFSIAADLAWFSSNTHLLSLLVVRSFEGSYKNGGSPLTQVMTSNFRYTIPSCIRIVLMGIVAILLLYCSWISGYSEWDDEFRCLTSCTKGFPKGGVPQKWMIVNFFLIFWSYPPSMLLLIPRFRKYWIDTPRKKLFPEQSQQPALSSKYNVFQYIWYFLASETEGVLEQGVWFALGVYWTVTDRREGHSAMEAHEAKKEKEWGFGQMLPLFLLILPVMQFIETLNG